MLAASNHIFACCCEVIFSDCDVCGLIVLVLVL